MQEFMHKNLQEIGGILENIRFSQVLILLNFKNSLPIWFNFPQAFVNLRRQTFVFSYDLGIIEKRIYKVIGVLLA